MGGYSARLYGLLRHRPCVGRLQYRVVNATRVDRPLGPDSLGDVPPEGGVPLGRGCDDVPELIAGLVTRGRTLGNDARASSETGQPALKSPPQVALRNTGGR